MEGRERDFLLPPRKVLMVGDDYANDVEASADAGMVRTRLLLRLLLLLRGRCRCCACCCSCCCLCCCS